MELLRGRTTVLDVTYLPADTDDDRTITWSSSDSSIASVDAETGMITALKAGTAVITAQTSTLNQATGEPFTASAEVTVVENSLTEESAGQIHLNIPEEGIYKGQKTDLNQLLNLDEIVGGSNADEMYEEHVLPKKNKLRVKYAATVSFGTDCRLFFLTVGKVLEKVVKTVLRKR